MLEIYSKASTVFIWLHSEGHDDHMRIAFHRLHTANLIATSGQKTEDFQRLQDALALLLRRSWFSRGWTFQELMLGSNPIFITSQGTQPWENVCVFVLKHASVMPMRPELLISKQLASACLFACKLEYCNKQAAHTNLASKPSRDSTACLVAWNCLVILYFGCCSAVISGYFSWGCTLG